MPRLLVRVLLGLLPQHANRPSPGLHLQGSCRSTLGVRPAFRGFCGEQPFAGPPHCSGYSFWRDAAQFPHRHSYNVERVGIFCRWDCRVRRVAVARDCAALCASCSTRKTSRGVLVCGCRSPGFGQGRFRCGVITCVAFSFWVLGGIVHLKLLNDGNVCRKWRCVKIKYIEQYCWAWIGCNNIVSILLTTMNNVLTLPSKTLFNPVFISIASTWAFLRVYHDNDFQYSMFRKHNGFVSKARVSACM